MIETTTVLLLVAVMGVANDPRIEKLLSAIEQVETGGHPDPANAVGDGGKSRGPYQIGFAYYCDAVRKDPSIGRDTKGDYLAVVQTRRGSRRVVRAYWSRYCRDGVQHFNPEKLARLHNGGCNLWRSKAASRYWRKVQAIMRSKP